MSPLQFIDHQRPFYPVQQLCQVLGVMPSRYYTWRHRLAASAGGIGWRHRLVASAGGIGWWHRLVASAGGIGWRHRLVASASGIG